MNRFHHLTLRYLPFALVALALASYTVIFGGYHHQLGVGIASLATIPVVVAGWYFGIQGGIVTAILAIAISGYFQSTADRPIQILLANPDNILRMISLLLVAVVTGRLSVFTRERREAVARLAHSNDLIYSILQITTHIEKALAPGEIQESLARELNELNLVAEVQTLTTGRNVVDPAARVVATGEKLGAGGRTDRRHEKPVEAPPALARESMFGVARLELP